MIWLFGEALTYNYLTFISRFKYLKMVLTHAIDLALQRESALKHPLANTSNANSFDTSKYGNNI